MKTLKIDLPDIIEYPNGIKAYRCECGNYRVTPCERGNGCYAFVSVPKVEWDEIISKSKEVIS